LNSYETLYFYGRIRGIKDEILVERVNSLIKQVGLTKHASFLSGTYSGGNKRKLSLAIALIGNPSLLILDEPSSGMDPYARRMMWTIISEVGQSRSVLLTTHNMEECEALCSRISIMVAGKLKCIGTSQHLKKKYGIGYQVEIKFGIKDTNSAESEEELDNLVLSEYLDRIDFLTSSLPLLTLEEQHNNLARFNLITNSSTSVLGDLFNFLELHREKIQIADYSVSQVSKFIFLFSNLF
jgi:ABC-type multidrug transport system ATPase subunit